MIDDRIVPEGSAGPGNIVPAEQVDDPSIVPETSEEASRQGPDQLWTFWDQQIRAGLKHESRWRKEAKQAEDLYFGDEKASSDPTTMDSVSDETSLIHANIEVEKPHMYSNTPTPIVRRRFRGDGDPDPTDLHAAEVAQRLAEYILDTEPFDEAMERARDDWLIAGRGLPRVNYKAALKTGDDGVERKVAEKVTCSALYWPRVVMAPTESWDTMPWIAFETPMSRSNIEKRFGREAAEMIIYGRMGMVDRANSTQAVDDEGMFSDGDLNQQARTEHGVANPFDTATVWEIWVKDERKVVWWSPDYRDSILQEIEDPLGLEMFWPCPKPMLAARKGDRLTPRPSIIYYRARAKEVDEASRKIKSILRKISVSALVPGTNKDEVDKLLDGEDKIIPVASWIKLMEKGGINNIIGWLPIEAMVAAINALLVLRNAALQAMYEASGISDIMRAQGDPTETATAQQLKGQYSGKRISGKQKTASTCALGLMRIMLEVGLEHFDTATIAEMTGLDLPVTEADRQAIAQQAAMMQAQYEQAMQMYPIAAQMAQRGLMPMPEEPTPPPPVETPETSYELVHERLRRDFTRKIMLTIETDSTILADEQTDKQARIEFLQAFSALASELMPMIQSGVIPLATIKELLLFGVRGFPKARTIEGMIADLPDDMEGQGDQGPDVAVQVAQIRAQVDQMIAQLESQDKQKDRDHELRMKGVELVEDAARMAAEPSQPPEPQPAQ